MPEFELEDARRHPSSGNGVLHPAPMPTNAAPTLTALPVVIQETDNLRVWHEGIRSELDEYYKLLRSWADAEPDLVLSQISAIGARMTEVRAHLMRENGQRSNKLRLNEIDPMIDALKEQFKLHSRLISVREFDWKVAGGAET